MKLITKITISVVLCVAILFLIAAICLALYFESFELANATGTWEYNDGNLRITVYIPKGGYEFRSEGTPLNVCKAKVCYNDQLYEAAFVYDTLSMYQFKLMRWEGYAELEHIDELKEWIFHSTYSYRTHHDFIKLKNIRLEDDFKDLLSEYENKDIVLTRTGEYK